MGCALYNTAPAPFFYFYADCFKYRVYLLFLFNFASLLLELHVRYETRWLRTEQLYNNLSFYVK